MATRHASCRETERFVDPIGIMGEKIKDGQEAYSGDMQLQSLTPEERQAISVLGTSCASDESRCKTALQSSSQDAAS